MKWLVCPRVIVILWNNAHESWQKITDQKRSYIVSQNYNDMKKYKRLILSYKKIRNYLHRNNLHSYILIFSPRRSSTWIRNSQRETKRYVMGECVSCPEAFSWKIWEKHADERVLYHSLHECFRKAMVLDDIAIGISFFLLSSSVQKARFLYIRHLLRDNRSPHSPGFRVSSFLSHFKRRLDTCVRASTTSVPQIRQLRMSTRITLFIQPTKLCSTTG